MQKEDSTARSREVAQPSTDVARDCLISRFGVELDVSSRVWPLQRNSMTFILISMLCKLTILVELCEKYYIYITFSKISMYNILISDFYLYKKYAFMCVLSMCNAKTYACYSVSNR